MAEDQNGKMEKCEMENFLINWEMSCKKKKKKKIAVACSNFTLHINGVENI